MIIRALTEAERDAMRRNKAWRDGCLVPFERLRRIEVRHFDFNGQMQHGAIDVLDAIAENAAQIFTELLTLKFPIAQIKPIENFGADPAGDAFGGNDVASMEANNSHGFNHRRMLFKDAPSVHSYGCAIDINPTQNPYAIIDEEKATAQIYPKASALYLNRHNMRPGMVEPIVPIFKKHGFAVWGGEWNTPLDYHHFQLPSDIAKDLAEASPEKAAMLFAAHLKN